jgi:AcrR family transcriptional regulator
MNTREPHRARDPEETRRRIVEATVALHEEVGPAATTVSAIAERAGVQRLTVYRHLPDEGALIRACSAHWGADHPLPDTAAWAGLTDPRARLGAALEAVYGYFRSGRRMLEQVLRDEPMTPELGAVMVPYHSWFRELAGQLSAGWGATVHVQRRIRAAVGHGLRFESWRSLTDEGLTDSEAAALIRDMIACLAVSGCVPE